MLIMHALYKCRKCDRCRRDFTDFVLLVLTPGSLTMQLRMRQKRGGERRFKLAPVVWIFGLMAACAYAAEGASAEWGALLLMTKGAGLDASASAFAAFAAAAVVCRLVSSASSYGGASQRGADDGRQSHCGGRGLDALFL